MLRIGVISVFLLITFQQAKSATISSTALGGPWTSTSTWAGGVVPGGNDDVIIVSGSNVLLNNSNVGSGIKSLTIESLASVVLSGANNIQLNVKGNIVNNGTLNLWLSGTRGAALYIMSSSTWSGSGSWNLAQINIGANSVEFAEDITVTINRKIDVDPGTGSLNMVNQRSGITFIFAGTEKASIPSQGDRVFYGNIDFRKTVDESNLTFTQTGSASGYNTISVLGDITLATAAVNSNAFFGIGDFNTLDIRKGLSGGGKFTGGAKSDVVINGSGAAANLNVTTLRNLTVNRAAGVVLAGSLTVQETLALNNSCRLILPSGNNYNLSIGIAGTSGTITGNGFLVQPAWTLVRELADITILGNAPAVNLRFSQTGTENVIHDLIIDKPTGVVNLMDGGTLQVRNTFNFKNGIFAIGFGTLKLTGTITAPAAGLLRGSTNATLFLGNEVASTAATLNFDQLDASSQTLKTYRQLRNSTVTLGSNLNIVESVDLSGGAASNVLNSNGKLTLLSTAQQTAYVTNLGSSSITGNVNVQRYVSGGSLAYRGYRLTSSPIATGNGVYNFQYLKNGALLSGAADGGFDKDGNPSIFLYREDLKPGGASFTSGNFKGIAKINNTDVNDTGTQKHGTVTNVADTTVQVPVGNGALFFFRGDRFNNIAGKTQAPFAPAEAVVFSSSGTLNQKNIPVKIWYKNSTLLGFTDYSAANAAVRGYNLIGNPYASTIDWNSNSGNAGNGILMSSSADIDQKIFYINNTSPNQNYIWYDAASGLSSDPKAGRYIASGQGFFIRAKKASATLTFTENAKSNLQPPTLLMGRPEKESKQAGFYLKLRLDSVIHDYCSVYFDKAWSDDFTEEDAPDMDGASPQLYLSTLSADGRRLAMNKSAEPGKFKSIPLHVDAAKSGTFSLSLEQITGLLEKTHTMWLKDSFKGDSVAVHESQAYTFTIDKANPQTFGSRRFTLIIEKQKPPVVNAILDKLNPVQGHSDLMVFPNPATERVRLKNYASGAIVHGHITDAFGHAVLTIKNPGQLVESGIDVRSFYPGLYFLRLQTADRRARTIPFIKL